MVSSVLSPDSSLTRNYGVLLPHVKKVQADGDSEYLRLPYNLLHGYHKAYRADYRPGYVVRCLSVGKQTPECDK